MLAVYELQEAIKALGKGTPHSLDKICFAPLRREEEEETSTSECVVESIWGYYQDDIATFNSTGKDPKGFKTNYLDTFLSCAA